MLSKALSRLLLKKLASWYQRATGKQSATLWCQCCYTRHRLTYIVWREFESTIFCNILPRHSNTMTSRHGSRGFTAALTQAFCSTHHHFTHPHRHRGTFLRQHIDNSDACKALSYNTDHLPTTDYLTVQNPHYQGADAYFLFEKHDRSRTFPTMREEYLLSYHSAEMVLFFSLIPLFHISHNERNLKMVCWLPESDRN